MKFFPQIFTAARIWSFNLSCTAITLGTVIASDKVPVSFESYLLCLCGTLFFHGGANMLNDYCDVRNKIDTPKAPTALYRSHPIYALGWTQKQLLSCAIIFLAVGIAIGLYFALYKSSWVWPFLIAGLFFAIFYTCTHMGLKYIALGEFVVFLVFGPLMVEGAYTVQTGVLSAKVLALSLPLGVFAGLVLLANNLRDRNFDRQSGVKTLPILLKKRGGSKLFAILTFLPFLLVGIYVYIHILPWPALIIFFTLPYGFQLVKKFSISIPAFADKQVSQLAFTCGSLLICALILNNLLVKS